jgi:predicted DNA-binding protein
LGQAKSTFKRIDIILRSEEYDALLDESLKLKATVASVIRDLIREHLEEQEDILEGMKALGERENTVDWETFKRSL